MQITREHDVKFEEKLETLIKFQVPPNFSELQVSVFAQVIDSTTSQTKDLRENKTFTVVTSEQSSNIADAFL